MQAVFSPCRICTPEFVGTHKNPNILVYKFITFAKIRKLIQCFTRFITIEISNLLEQFIQLLSPPLHVFTVVNIFTFENFSV